MTIGSVFFIGAGAILKVSATVLAGIELGTLGVILLILVAIAGLALGLYSLWVILFVVGSDR